MLQRIARSCKLSLVCGELRHATGAKKSAAKLQIISDSWYKWAQYINPNLNDHVFLKSVRA
ncbi:MAG: hypothetical protein Q8L98_03770 [Chlamydiales bacterium]|nr:hypothetical protein [Chlamydiales bacterium]